jgi:hypothetical protein
MSLILRKRKPWERRAAFLYHLIVEVTTEFRESSDSTRQGVTTTTFPDDREPIVSEFEETDSYRQEGTTVYRHEEERGVNSYSSSTSTVRNTTTISNGETFETSQETYSEVEGDEKQERSSYRYILNGNTIIDRSETKQHPDPNPNLFSTEILGTDAEDKKGFEFKEKTEKEKFPGLDEQERFEIDRENLRYVLEDAIDRVDLVREVKGLEETETEYRLTLRRAESETDEADPSLHIAVVFQYYRTRSDADSGSRFYEIQAKTFGKKPLPFEDVWKEIPDGGEYEPPLERESEAYAIIGAGIEPEETEVYRVDAYTVPQDVPDGKGGFKLEPLEVEEVVQLETGYAWKDEDVIYFRVDSYETPALVKKGDHAMKVRMIRELFQYPEIVTRKAPKRYVIAVEEEDEDSDQNEWSYEDDYTIPPSDDEYGAEIRYQLSAQGSTSSSTKTTRIQTPVSYTQESIVEQRFGAQEATPFPVALVREVLTPGIAPFGEVDLETAFVRYETKTLVSGFGSTVPELQFEVPSVRLNGEIRAGRQKLDLSDREYEVTVSRPKYKFKRTVRGGPPDFLESEKEEALTRTALVKQKWVYPDPDAKTHSTAILHRTVKDSDGVIYKDEIEFTLKEKIPRNELTGDTIDRLSDGKWIVVGEKDATLHYGRCRLHVTEVDKDGKERTFTAQADREGTLTVKRNTSISVRVERLWLPLGKLGGGPILERGGYYLHS